MSKRKLKVKRELGLQIKRESNRELSITLTIPETAWRGVDDDGVWTGQVQVTIQGDKSSRLAKIRSRQEAGKERKSKSLTPNERWLVKRWNQNASEPSGHSAQRNREINPSEAMGIRNKLRSSLKQFNQRELSDLITEYFHSCESVSPSGTDWRYKHLGGFLTAIMDSERLKSLWWREHRGYNREDDPLNDITKMVAYTFHQLILKTPFKNKPSPDWVHFAYVAKQMERLLDDGIPLDSNMFARGVIRCALKVQRDKGKSTVWPSHLSASSLWTTALPQYLDQHFPGLMK